jgi:hypothetical protein
MLGNAQRLLESLWAFLKGIESRWEMLRLSAAPLLIISYHIIQLLAQTQTGATVSLKHLNLRSLHIDELQSGVIYLIFSFRSIKKNNVPVMYSITSNKAFLS